MGIFKLPSGVKLNEVSAINKAEFFEMMPIHYPFSKMQKDKQYKAIDLDWKAYQKALGKIDTVKVKAKVEAEDK